MSTRSDTLPRRAVLEMIGGAILISTTSIFVKLAHVGPTVSAFYRMLFGGAILLAGLIALGRWQRVRAMYLVWLLVPSLAFAIDLMMWHRSILYIGPGLATLLGNFQVFVMALAGWLIYRERLGPPFVFGVLLAFVGLYLLVGLDWSQVGPQYRLGVILGVVTGVAYAVYLLTTRHAQRSGKVPLEPAQLLCVSSLLCAAMLGIAVLGEGDSFVLPDAKAWWSLLGLAVVGQVLGWILLLRAMPNLPASMIGLLLLLQPALSFVFDVILFGRVTRTLDWVGVAISLIGIFIGSYRPAPVAEPVVLPEEQR
jgi:drug/metabolite transporter (DMT)-like permease